MAVTDDLKKLEAEDVVYLTRTFSGMGGQTHGSSEVYRGRVRQALSGNWVFNASTGQNGAVGFMLGSTGQNSWSSSESPATGLQVTVTFNAFMVMITSQPTQTLNEVIVLSTLIPTDLAD